MRNLILFLSLILPIGAPVIDPAGAQTQQGPTYWVRLSIEGIPHGGPLKGTTFKLTGPGIKAVEGPQGATVRAVSEGNGFAMGEASSIVVYVEPGEYQVKFAKEGHEGGAYVIKVPIPGEEETTELDFVCQLRLRKELRAHRIIVVVEGEKEGGGTKRLNEARVFLWTEDRFGGRPNLENFTNGFGIKVLNTASATMGDLVRVRVESEGYESQEKELLLGDSPLKLLPESTELVKHILDNQVFSSLINIGEVWERYVDGARFLLKKTDKTDKYKRQPPGPGAARTTEFVFEAVNFTDNSPIPKATVKVEEISGKRQLGSSTTDAKGLTRKFGLTSRVPGQLHATYRVTVSANGYHTQISDIPDDLVQSGKARTYAVLLSRKGGPRDSWTPAERAAYDRMAAWAKTKPLDKEDAGKKLYLEDVWIQVSWKELKSDPDGPPYHKGFASMGYVQHKPGDPLPTYPEPTDKMEKRVMVGGYPGILTVDRQLRRIRWFQGWFQVEVMYQSQSLIKPTVEEALAVAQEVAGVIGNPGK